MYSVMKLLEDEHLNMLRLLDVLERQIDAFSYGGAPNYEIIDAVLEYTIHFPGVSHHPMEDLIHQRILDRDPSAARGIGDIIGQHVELESLLGRLATAVNNVHLDVEIPRREVEELARHLLTAYRDHIVQEDRDFFPVARRVLTDDDWAEIGATVHELEDPLFGPRITDAYRNLHNEIVSLDAAEMAVG